MSAQPAESVTPPEAGPVSSSPRNELVPASDSGSDSSNGADSSMGKDAASSTASVSSSILEYRRLQRRTYHSEKFESNYFLPNDDRLLESLDLTHHYLTILLDEKLFLAPVKEETCRESLMLVQVPVSGPSMMDLSSRSLVFGFLLNFFKRVARLWVALFLSMICRKRNSERLALWTSTSLITSFLSAVGPKIPSWPKLDSLSEPRWKTTSRA